MTAHMNTQFLQVLPNGEIRAASDALTADAQAGLTELLAFSRSTTDSFGRTRWDTHEVSMRRLDAHHREVHRDLKQRADSYRGDAAPSIGLGAFNPRDLTHKMRRVLEERRKPLSARQVYPINTEVQPGALSYEQSRLYSTGQAVAYKGGNGEDVEDVGLGRAFFTAPVIYLISAYSINWLEQLRVNMTGLNVQVRKMRGARRVISELENKLAWEGSTAWNIYGVLNHPYVDRVIVATTFSATADVATMSKELSDLANYAEDESGSTFQPDTAVFAPKLFNFLNNKKFGSGDQETLMERFRKSHPHITKIEKARELNDYGGTGVHAVTFHRRGLSAGDSSIELVQTLPTTIIQGERRGLSTRTFLVSGFGGANQTEVGDNLIALITLE